jgi:hypothetical protein
VPEATLSRADLLGNAPDAATEAGLFKVPSAFAKAPRQARESK